MARDDPMFRLRMPADLKQTLTQAAKINHRSLNAEIVQRLELTLAQPSGAASGVALSGEQAQALQAFLQSLNGKPVVFASEYQSPHEQPGEENKAAS